MENKESQPCDSIRYITNDRPPSEMVAIFMSPILHTKPKIHSHPIGSTVNPRECFRTWRTRDFFKPGTLFPSFKLTISIQGDETVIDATEASNMKIKEILRGKVHRIAQTSSRSRKFQPHTVNGINQPRNLLLRHR